MDAPDQRGLVSELAMRQLDAAYNLARWLLGNESDAGDAVHDAFVRALQSAHTYAGGNAKAWWLTIVRHCCFARLKERDRGRRFVAIDQLAADFGEAAAQRVLPKTAADQMEQNVAAAQESAQLHRQLRSLPEEYREVVILREIEELSYREIAEMLSIPIGTVMSRLSRGREKLLQALAAHAANTGDRP
jgi:RNA polymerase sigma-70 factor (ECF subfamily)